LPVLKERLELKVHKGYQVKQDMLVLKEQQDSQEQLDSKELMVL
jgi:hypothetical protein